MVASSPAVTVRLGPAAPYSELIRRALRPRNPVPVALTPGTVPPETLKYALWWGVSLPGSRDDQAKPPLAPA